MLYAQHCQQRARWSFLLPFIFLVSGRRRNIQSLLQLLICTTTTTTTTTTLLFVFGGDCMTCCCCPQLQRFLEFYSATCMHRAGSLMRSSVEMPRCFTASAFGSLQLPEHIGGQGNTLGHSLQFVVDAAGF